MVDLVTAILLLALTLISIWAAIGFLGIGKNLPPGPLKIPIIGTHLLFKWGAQPFRMFTKLAEKYGDVMYIRMGSQDTVLLSSHKAIHEAFVTKSEDFKNRPRHLSSIKQTSGAKGVIWQNGETWKALRRFTLTTLRDFGVGKNLIEERIMEEVEEITKIFDASLDRPVEHPKVPFSKAIANIMCALVFGERYEYDDPILNGLLFVIELAFASGAAQHRPETYVSLLRYLPQNKTAWEHIIKARDDNYKFIQGQIDTHKKTYDVNNIRDVVDTYIAIVQGEREGTKFDEADMFRLILDLYVAGSETTATTINWAVKYMIAYPEIQQKCQEEIDQVIGGRSISMKDKASLPYVDATLKEVERLACVATITVPHCTTQDTSVGGYFIPKDTIVLGNLFAAMRDPKIFPHPEELCPDRFLGADGKIDPKKLENLIPFGTGPRVCLGEGLARIETFIIFSNLMQRFKFTKTPGTQTMDLLEGTQVTTRYPRSYRVIITRR